MEQLKRKIPWRIKLWVKIIIAKIGLTSFLQKSKIFCHGNSSPERVFEIFKNHFSKTKGRIVEKDFVVLELGPGYSVYSAVFATCFGAKFTYLVDNYLFVGKMDLQLAKLFLEQKNIKCLSENDIKYEYLTNGLESLKKIPDDSVDFIFSNDVLEHIKRDELLPIIKELGRILKKRGLCSHIVDLKDHLGESLNSLRFSEKFWESELVRNSGFYTNRIRFSEMLDMFKEVGFNCEIVSRSKFEKLLPQKNELDKQFREFDKDDLMIATFHIILSRKLL